MELLNDNVLILVFFMRVFMGFIKNVVILLVEWDLGWGFSC
jgi:hypothetical protein